MTVAVAHQDTAEGRAALLRAAAEAELIDQPLAVLQVIDGTEPPDDQLAAALRPAIDEQLTAAGHATLSWRLHLASAGPSAAGASTAGTLVDLAAEAGATLLVIGSGHRSAIGKFLLGSTVQRVILDAPIPVLVVKPRTEI